MAVTSGTYKFGLVPLDDISVLPLVLLHPQLGVLHIDVVCQVVHYMGRTQTSMEGGTKLHILNRDWMIPHHHFFFFYYVVWGKLRSSQSKRSLCGSIILLKHRERHCLKPQYLFSSSQKKPESFKLRSVKSQEVICVEQELMLLKPRGDFICCNTNTAQLASGTE